MPKITMLDIAKEMGVSKTTVSRALNDKTDISEELRAKILDKCQELGYFRNNSARSLSSKSNMSIGILINEVINEKGEFFYKEIYTNVVMNLDLLGYTTILKIVTQSDLDKNIPPNFAAQQMVDGIIIIGQLPKAFVELTNKFKIPVVLADFDLGNLQFDSVVTNNIVSVSNLTKSLIEDGYQKITFVGNDKLTSSILERFWGYKMEMKNAGLNISQMIDRTASNQEPSFNLDLIKAQDVFICDNDYTAYKLIEYLKQNNLLISQQKRVIGFDNTFYSEVSSPKISTVNVRRDVIANQVVKLLLDRIKNPDKEIVNISLNADYVVKES